MTSLRTMAAAARALAEGLDEAAEPDLATAQRHLADRISERGDAPHAHDHGDDRWYSDCPACTATHRTGCASSPDGDGRQGPCDCGVIAKVSRDAEITARVTLPAPEE